MGSKTATSRRGASTQAFQLYVELEWVRPKVWRRFLVPVAIGLPLLHATLLFGMGWQGGHLHEFVFGNDSYGRKEPGLELDHVMDEERVTLCVALGARKTFVYVYDYGDDWRHKVKIEKVVMLDAPIASGVCIGGENACPPEDVGGAPGYGVPRRAGRPRPPPTFPASVRRRNIHLPARQAGAKLFSLSRLQQKSCRRNLSVQRRMR